MHTHISKVVGAMVAIGFPCVAQAVPASASATKNFGSRDCASTWVIETSTYSTGTTVHTQIGTTTKVKTFSNGGDIIRRYYSAGLNSVSASSATTTGTFSSGTSKNYVTCTN